jgi:hypoxanthine phosphoribosyltransferase
MNQRNEIITWDEVSRLIDHLLPQFNRVYTVMVMITRGGIIPGGMLAEAMNVQTSLPPPWTSPPKRTPPPPPNQNS